jgi:hypothetical protein
MERVHQFIHLVRMNYRENPYHSFTHAFQITQLGFYILKKSSTANTMLMPSDSLSLLIASLGHDLRHPGVNNTYLINTNHDLASTYNDLSVLENYHASTLMKIIDVS